MAVPNVNGCRRGNRVVQRQKESGEGDSGGVDATADDELELDESLEHPPPAYPDKIQDFEVAVQQSSFSVFEMHRRYLRKQIILAPPFQRNDVWSTDARSLFVESALLGLPLPPLYLNLRADGAYAVVDGKQRLQSLFGFLQGKFAISEAERLQIKGMKFSDLPEPLRARLEDTTITVNVLQPSVPLAVVCDIFGRINRGGTPLNRQEIRHGILLGPGTELLDRLATSPAFREAIDGGVSEKRMKDRELVLRCLAFDASGSEYRDFSGDFDEFLSSELRVLNEAPAAYISSQEKRFINGMRECRRLFGASAFRIPTEKTRGSINAAVMESVYCAVVSHVLKLKRKMSPKRAQSAYRALLDDSQYLAAVKSQTSDVGKVETRFRLALAAFK